MKTLDLRMKRMTANGVTIKNSLSLQDLVKAIERADDDFDTADLGFNSLTDENLKPILEALGNKPFITTIILSGNLITKLDL